MAIIKYFGRHKEDEKLKHFFNKENESKYQKVGTFYEHRDDTIEGGTLHKSEHLDEFLAKLDIDTKDETKMHQNYIKSKDKRPKSYNEEFLRHLEDNEVKLKGWNEPGDDMPVVLVYEENNDHSNRYVKNNFLKATVYRLNDDDLAKGYKEREDVHRFIKTIDSSYTPKIDKDIKDDSKYRIPPAKDVTEKKYTTPEQDKYHKNAA